MLSQKDLKASDEKETRLRNTWIHLDNVCIYFLSELYRNIYKWINICKNMHSSIRIPTNWLDVTSAEDTGRVSAALKGSLITSFCIWFVRIFFLTFLVASELSLIFRQQTFRFILLAFLTLSVTFLCYLLLNMTSSLIV